MQRDLRELHVLLTKKPFSAYSGYFTRGINFWCVGEFGGKLCASTSHTPNRALTNFISDYGLQGRLSNKWIDKTEMHMQHDEFLGNGIPLRAYLMHIRKLILDLIVESPKTPDEVRDEIRKGKDPREYKLKDREKYPAFKRQTYEVLRGALHQMDYRSWRVSMDRGDYYDNGTVWYDALLPLFPDIVIRMI